MKKFLPLLCEWIIRLLVSTLRMKVEDHGGVLDKPDHPPVIIAFWHNRLFLMPPFWERYCRGRVSMTFISRSRDGQFMTDVAARFGVRATRGSSSRHGMAAALAAIRAAHNDRLDIVITPDGPRGPRYEIQPGILRLAQATQRPIVAITTFLGWKITLKSWDRFQIPLPFSTCRLVTEEPIFVPEQATETDLAEIGARVKNALGGD
jgi:lysophospholipid acyltransferase (LPLAT)-like uncharacterized protein